MSGERKGWQAFLAAAGWPAGCRLEPLPADASFRRYIRVHGGPRPALIMDAPPAREHAREFVAIASHLRGLDLSAPEIIAADLDDGYLLIEDFGDDTYTRVLERAPGDETALYELAIDTLTALQTHPKAASIDLPAYDFGHLMQEALLFVDWYLPAVTGRLPSAEQRTALVEAWRQALTALPPAPPCLVLRDFHIDNLMLLPGRDGIARCGLLDFQDGLIGAAAYDLVSLLEDARRDVPADLALSMRARHRAALSAADAALVDAWYPVLGVQRHFKVAGIFVRLNLRDGKKGYLRHVPRVLAMLMRGVEDCPALAPVAAWLDGALPDLAPVRPEFDRLELRRLLGLPPEPIARAV